jgi:hypothetical protein
MFDANLLLVLALCGDAAPNGTNALPVAANLADDSWRKHPALTPPDDPVRPRGGPKVADKIDDARILFELSRRFKATRDQEYFLRLLDYYGFRGERLVGMTRGQVEGIFGTGPKQFADGQLHVPGGRDIFVVYFKDGHAIGAYYAIGY